MTKKILDKQTPINKANSKHKIKKYFLLQY
jgi:hypothetical protein